MKENINGLSDERMSVITSLILKISKYPLTSFVIVTYGITWLSLVPLFVTGIEETEIILLFGLFGPALSAYIVTRVCNPEQKGARNPQFWWVFVSMWVVGTLIWSFESYLRSQIPILIALSVMSVPSLLLAWMCANNWNRRPSIRIFFRDLVIPKGPWWVFAFCILYFPISHYCFTYIAGSEQNLWQKNQTGIAYIGLWFLVSAKILLFTGGVNEEIGWRGFLLKGILEKHNPVVGTLIIWIIWAIWHFPLELGPTSNMSLYEVIEKWLWMLPPTAIFTWAFIRTGGSILVCALLHTSMNVTSYFIPITTEAKMFTIVVIILLFIELKFQKIADDVQ
jgi:CAAX protease family protein